MIVEKEFVVVLDRNHILEDCAFVIEHNTVAVDAMDHKLDSVDKYTVEMDEQQDSNLHWYYHIRNEHSNCTSVSADTIVVEHASVVVGQSLLAIVEVAVVQPIEDWKNMRYSSVDLK